MTSSSGATGSIERALERSRAPELALALRGALVATAVAVPTAVVAGVVRGVPGVAGAALAAGLVIGLFATTGVVLACVQRWRPATLPAASLAGAIARMVAYGVVLAALAGVDGIDRGSTVGATCMLLIATLADEMRYASTTPGFYWVRTPPPEGVHAKERTRG
ncbi:MAG: hypothetical protein KY460_10085 [Actinobacteria bacterium]|nr:hypothetical protein [Actinomycetota bacterium]